MSIHKKVLLAAIDTLSKEATGLPGAPGIPTPEHSAKPGEQFQHYKEEHPGTHKTESDFMAKTRSGKPIHHEFSHPSHANFNHQDHLDAADAHIAEAEKRGPYSASHLQSAQHHMNAARGGMMTLR